MYGDFLQYVTNVLDSYFDAYLNSKYIHFVQAQLKISAMKNSRKIPFNEIRKNINLK